MSCSCSYTCEFSILMKSGLNYCPDINLWKLIYGVWVSTKWKIYIIAILSKDIRPFQRQCDTVCSIKRNTLHVYDNLCTIPPFYSLCVAYVYSWRKEVANAYIRDICHKRCSVMVIRLCLNVLATLSLHISAFIYTQACVTDHWQGVTLVSVVGFYTNSFILNMYWPNCW